MPAAPQNVLFDPVTGDLLPAQRDAYLHGRLAPAAAAAVETYLRSSPIQADVVLGRYRALAAGAGGQGPPLAAPRWVRQQLTLQANAAKTGPLRRPVVRVALGMFLALSLASAVQWARNEPLVPVPVAAAVARVAAAATTTQRLVQRFAAPAAAEAPASAPTPATERPATAGGRTGRPRAAAATPAIAARPVAVAAVPTDSLARSLPVALGAGRTAPALTSTAPAGTVTGRISDVQGLRCPGPPCWCGAPARPRAPTPLASIHWPCLPGPCYSSATAAVPTRPFPTPARAA